jgi:hypothetical protein
VGLVEVVAPVLDEEAGLVEVVAPVVDEETGLVEVIAEHNSPVGCLDNPSS